MKRADVVSRTRTRVIGFAVVLALHAVVAYSLWSCHIVAPSVEAPTVFVRFINPAAPVQALEPVGPRTSPVSPVNEPVRRETARPATPVAPKLPVSAAPVNSPADPVTAPAPVVRTAVAPASASPPSVSRSVNLSPSITGSTQPLMQQDELSVSCTDRPAPSYPRLSERLRERGKAVLRVELDEFGRAAKIEVQTSSGFPRLDEAAVNAVKNWRCTPAKRGGVAVRSVALQPINFTLKGR